MAAAPHWAEVTKGVLAGAQILALVLGGAWAYFKFVAGRTFTERLEVSVEATPFKAGDAIALRIRTAVANTGASKVELNDDAKVAYVFGVIPTNAVPGFPVAWGNHLTLMPMFARHKWIEAQETI